MIIHYVYFGHICFSIDTQNEQIFKQSTLSVLDGLWLLSVITCNGNFRGQRDSEVPQTLGKIAQYLHLKKRVEGGDTVSTVHLL
jgi:hypothetical protein